MFGAYNPEWDGSSELRSEARAVDSAPSVATNVEEYETVSPNETVAVILSPDEPYTDQEADRVREFVDAGGTLVIAEDFGSNSNPLLERLGASTRVDGRLVRDERRYYRSPDFLVATDVAASELTGETNRITFNHGTVLEPNGANVLVHTSSFAYLDTNRNGSLDASESMQRYPVVTAETIGSGQVVTISDPSIFINAMMELPGNQRFTRALFAGHANVVLDYSHGGSVPPLVQATLALQRTPVIQAIFGIILVGAVAAVSALSVTNRLKSSQQIEQLQLSQVDRLRSRVQEAEKRDSAREGTMAGIINEDTKDELND